MSSPLPGAIRRMLATAWLATGRLVGAPLRRIGEIREPAVADPNSLSPGDAPPTGGRLLVLYDGECGICLHGRDLIARLDRRGALAHDLIQRHATGLLADLDDTTRLSSWHVVRQDGRRESSGAALARVLEALPLGNVTAPMARAAMPLTDRAYGALARHRVAVSRSLGLANHPELRTRR